MVIRYIPHKDAVDLAMLNDDPLLMLIGFDREELIISNIDYSMEHHILLKQAGHEVSEIDSFFRLVVNRSGADWTFVCPESYKRIVNRHNRIKTFYNDGVDIISRTLSSVGYNVPINIPQRYRRHLSELQNKIDSH